MNRCRPGRNRESEPHPIHNAIYPTGKTFNPHNPEQSMKKAVFPILFALIALSSLHAQKQAGALSAADLERMDTYEDTLALLGYAVVNDSTPDNRFLATRALILKLKEALKSPNSFKYPFKRLQTVSIQYPADSTFRIFTWQLYVDVNEYRYYGAIQMNTPDLQLIPLIDRSFDMEEMNLETAKLTNDKWYGTLCYNIRQVETPRGNYYLLFGFDGYKFFTKRKLIDVLTFQDGKPVFGAPVFLSEDQGGNSFSKSRVLLEYSAEASVKLNYDPTYEMILFDHLEEMGAQYGTEGPQYYPDGTYEAYKLGRDGLWHYLPKVFDQVSDTPPVPAPLDEKHKRNLFKKQ